MQRKAALATQGTSWLIKKPGSADRGAPVTRQERRRHTPRGVLGYCERPSWHGARGIIRSPASAVQAVSSSELKCLFVSLVNLGERTRPGLLSVQTPRWPKGKGAHTNKNKINGSGDVLQSHRPGAFTFQSPWEVQGTLTASAHIHVYGECKCRRHSGLCLASRRL